MRITKLLFIGVVFLFIHCNSDDYDLQPFNDHKPDKRKHNATIPSKSDKNYLLDIRKENKALHKFNWSLKTPISNWNGVKVEKGRITYLDISNIELEQIPKQIEQLTALKYLYLNNTNIKGPIPKFLVNLPQLRLVNLSNNEITSIPKELADAPKLRILLLNNNQLNSIPKEIGLLKLLIFSIEKNPITKPLPKEICEAFNFDHPSFSKGINVGCEE